MYVGGELPLFARNLLSNMYQNLIGNILCYNTTKSKISGNSAHQIFRLHGHKIFVTDRHFVKIVKSCFGHPKNCKFGIISILSSNIEFRRKSKIFITKHYFVLFCNGINYLLLDLLIPRFNTLPT